jgi:hypothetical protein
LNALLYVKGAKKTICVIFKFSSVATIYGHKKQNTFTHKGNNDNFLLMHGNQPPPFSSTLFPSSIIGKIFSLTHPSFSSLPLFCPKIPWKNGFLMRFFAAVQQVGSISSQRFFRSFFALLVFQKNSRALKAHSSIQN